MSEELVEYLSGFVSEKRLKRFNELIQHRTRHVTVVLEDIYQTHNASAVLRSCDCFGVQDVHIIENKNKYELNPDVELGSHKWLSLHRYNKQEHNTLECIQSLKQKGYKIIATTPHPQTAEENSEQKKKSCTIEKLDLTNKIALVFGTELNGITNVVSNEADSFVKIPMYGFTESFNISVSAAICLYELTARLRKSDLKWHLSNEETIAIQLQWLRNSLTKPELIEEKFSMKQKP